MTDLYLIRHGEMNPIKDFMRDDGLSPLGRLQAERLRDRLAATHEIKADVLITSTFPRALQTAEIIAPALDLVPLPDDDIQEMRSGEAYGLPVEEFREKYQEVDYEENPFRALAPGAETPVYEYTRNTSITHWRQITSQRRGTYWRLIKYNDVFHLHDIGTSARIPWAHLSARPASDDDRPVVPLETEEEKP